jgi:hypothetical protein
MKAGKALGAGIALLALTVVISGCVEFVGEPRIKQVAKKPKVDVVFKVCTRGHAYSNCGGGLVAEPPGRLLVAFRVPKGAKVPKRFKPRRVNGEGSIRLARNPSYSKSLNERLPKPKAFRWIGYSSGEVTKEQLELADKAAFRVRLGVPKRLVGKRFRVTPVVGVAQIGEEQPADAPIVCAEDPFEGTGATNNQTLMHCIDDPAERAHLKPLAVKVKPKKAKRKKRKR